MTFQNVNLIYLFYLCSAQHRHILRFHVHFYGFMMNRVDYKNPLYNWHITDIIFFCADDCQNVTYLEQFIYKLDNTYIL